MQDKWPKNDAAQTPTNPSLLNPPSHLSQSATVTLNSPNPNPSPLPPTNPSNATFSHTYSDLQKSSLSVKYDLLESIKSQNDTLKGSIESQKLSLMSETHKRKKLIDDYKNCCLCYNSHKSQAEKIKKLVFKESEKIKEKELMVEQEKMALNEQFFLLKQEIEKKILDKENLKGQCFTVLKDQESKLGQLKGKVNGVKVRRVELFNFFNYLSSKKVKNQAEIDTDKLDELFDKILTKGCRGPQDGNKVSGGLGLNAKKGQKALGKIVGEGFGFEAKKRSNVRTKVFDGVEAKVSDFKIDGQKNSKFEGEGAPEKGNYGSEKNLVNKSDLVNHKYCGLKPGVEGVAGKKAGSEEDFIRRNKSSKALFFSQINGKTRKSKEKNNIFKIPVLVNNYKISPIINRKSLQTPLN
jgi:hypothetical protein